MPFLPVNYMHWAKSTLSRCTYNLAMSGIARLMPDSELGLTADAWRLDGNNFYGYPELRSLLSQRYSVPEGNIMITQGTSLANFLLAAAVLQPGDDVIVEQPTYEPLLSILAPLNVTIQRLLRRPEENYAVNTTALRALVTPRTRMIILCSLHNPTGMAMSEATLREVGAIASSVGATVLVDEVYLDFLSPNERPSFLLGGPFVTTNSVTKVYGLGGLRVGWAFAPEQVVRTMYQVYNSLGVNNPFVSDHIARVLIGNGATERLAALARERSASGWMIAKEWLATRDDLTCATPDGGITCFPRLRSGESSEALVNRLITDFDTVIVPGRFFEDSSGFRLGFGGDEHLLREGLSRLAQALDSL
jgi:aspartate/methionine/tyrosine aminotransferase